MHDSPILTKEITAYTDLDLSVASEYLSLQRIVIGACIRIFAILQIQLVQTILTTVYMFSLLE